MSILVIAEHNNSELNPSTLHTITAASQVGGDITVLVAGHNAGAVATECANVAGVSSVIHADGAEYGKWHCRKYGAIDCWSSRSV